MCAVVSGGMGCGEATPVTALDATAPLDATLALDAGAAGHCTAGEQTACTCTAADGGVGPVGQQQCFEGEWLLCNCLPVLVQPGSTLGDCLAGDYLGDFKGNYRSGFKFGLPLDVSGALKLTLDQQKEGAGEFVTYAISNGVVSGKANDTYPFSGTLTGELNCTTKTFTAVFEGCYQLNETLGNLLQGCFKGPWNGVYNGKTHAFDVGSWDILEPNGALFNAGGNGTWAGTYQGPAGTLDGGPVDGGRADAGMADAGLADGG